MLEVGFAFFLDAEQADKLDTLIRPVNRFLQRAYRPKRRVCLRNERVRNRRKIAETRRRNRFPFKNRIGQSCWAAGILQKSTPCWKKSGNN